MKVWVLLKAMALLLAAGVCSVTASPTASFAEANEQSTITFPAEATDSLLIGLERYQNKSPTFPNSG